MIEDDFAEGRMAVQMRNSEIQMESGALYGGGGADVKNCYPRFLQLGATGLASRLMRGL